VKAAAYTRTGGPEVLEYVDVPDPVVRPSGIVIAVEAVGIQGGDLLHRAGGVMASSPHVVGYQAAGRVRDLGPDVTGLEVGQPVVATMAFGSHAELVSVPARSVYAIPDNLSIDEAAGVPIEFGTADDCLFEFGRLRAGETVLVQAGASGVGLAAVQLAARAGAAMVLATASSDQRLRRLHDFGVDHGINYTEQDVAGRVRELTDGRGVDLVVDPVGGTTLEDSIASLAYRGRVSWVGRAGREPSPPEVWPLMEKNASLTGVFLGAEMGRNPDRVRSMIEGLLRRVADGELRVVIDRVFALADASEAHRYIESRQAFGRVLLRPDPRARAAEPGGSSTAAVAPKGSG
jgi:NADPH:quinone reductase